MFPRKLGSMAMGLLLASASVQAAGVSRLTGLGVEAAADVAANQAALVQRQQALSAIQSARSALTRMPLGTAQALLSQADRLVLSGGAALSARQFAVARANFDQASLLARQALISIGQSTSAGSDGVAEATLRRRQEEADRRRLARAEELLHRVRLAASQSRNPILRQRFDQMQDNLVRVKRDLNPSPAIRFTNESTGKLAVQVRPLLEDAIQEGTAALATFDAQRRSERDLDQTKGRVLRVRKQVEGTTSLEARASIERADDQVRQSQEAGARGDYSQARILMSSAERSLQRALDLDRAAARVDSASTSAPRARKTSTPQLAEAGAGLDRMRSSLRAATTRLSSTDDPVTARLLVVAEADLERAQELYRRGQASQCTTMLKLVGRLLQGAYRREQASAQ